jgi:hypothetical protein
MLNRIRYYLSRHGSGDLTGWFDFSENLITGWAVDRADPSEDNLTVAAVRRDSVIASARVNGKDTIGWRFAIEIGTKVNGYDIVHEQVRVLVRDAVGHTQALRLVGSTQLVLIREFFSDPVTPLIEIGFSESGNSNAFVMEGWSDQEKAHRWTVGAQSTLAFTLPPHMHSCAVELLWPGRSSCLSSLPSNGSRFWSTELRLPALVSRSNHSWGA